MIIGDHKKRDKPHWADYALALAYETLESEKCPKCGVPAWHAYSENNAIAFEHDHIDCQSCAYDEMNSKGKKKRPGRTEYVKAIPEEGCELPDRKDFQQEMLAKALKQKEKSESTGSA
jgi:predicted nucleic-acid-binding Zn-ribbon protein